MKIITAYFNKAEKVNFPHYFLVSQQSRTMLKLQQEKIIIQKYKLFFFVKKTVAMLMVHHTKKMERNGIKINYDFSFFINKHRFQDFA